MIVVMISPGFPAEMPYFTRGLAVAGAHVLGVGDQPEHVLPQIAREHLAGYLHISSLLDESAAVDAVRRWIGPLRVDRVECLWEPGVLLAARLREALGATGMAYDQVVPFRNKDRMKQLLAAAGIRTPRHLLATSAHGCWEAAERIGFPLILKPIAGAGSLDTYRVDDAGQMRAALERTGHIAAMTVEEFIDGEEYTFDTLCIDGEFAYFNIAWYRPRPLVARSLEWISPQTICLRDVVAP